MNRLRGISEKIVHVYNPYPLPPPGVVWSDKYFAQQCKISGVREAKGTSGFQMLWQYSGGHDAEILLLTEEQCVDLRASEAKEFLREFEERGAVLVEDPDNEAQVVRASIEGISRAVDFYGSGGRAADRLLELQMIHQFTDEQMRLNRRAHWIYHVNEARAEMLRGYLVKLEERRDALARGRPAARKGAEQLSA